MANEALTQEKILHDTPRMSLDDTFCFECGGKLDCFTHCCADVAIVLTPYDVLRLKRALGMDSSEFLDRYTISPFTKEQKIPAVLLKMDPETKRCPFVTEQGCSVYQNRPWACRMYPLGVAEPRNPTPVDRTFHFLVREDICHGHERGNPISVRQWLEDQGIEEYEAMGASFRDLMLSSFWEKDEALTAEKMDMFYMSCYDLDRFRRFVFETRFLSLFDVDEARVEAIRTDDLELLEFAMQWLRFSLFGEKTMKLRKPDELRAVRQPRASAEVAP
jgi:uncharacterized protein